jgi:hypothetical protein
VRRPNNPAEATLEDFTAELLSFLETREQPLISWGFYDATFRAADIEQALADQAPEWLRQAWEAVRENRTLAELLQRMEAAGLLHGVESDDPEQPSHRTRFAEGVRLIGRLRQRFNPRSAQLNFTDWAVAPRLVADVKMHLTPRRYPERNLTAAAALAGMTTQCRTSPLQQEVFTALAGQVLFSGFQQRAFPHIFKRYTARGLSGSVVSAGTGAGKTKAFYVPAFMGIAGDLQREPFTKLIAIYPRNVLLADQLREALSEAGKLQPLLTRKKLRSITFAALLGETPMEFWFDKTDPQGLLYAVKYGWRKAADGFVVPFLKSPVVRGADLIWRDADRRAGRTCLYRAGADQPDVPDGQLLLTREAIAAHPPDVLFLSAEMLNRELGNPLWARTFGIDPLVQKPRLLLLDEVHTYEGLSGAQIAWLLRRWRFSGKIDDLHVVGLSATLKDAPRHLAAIAGVPVSNVVEFRPDDSEMTSEGMEYNLAIKGDPASGTNLLSVCIQTGMLLARLLTPRTAPPAAPGRLLRPEAFYSSKVFGFTDNLDGVNRWFSDMLSAENMRLANLRVPPESIPANLPRPAPAQARRMRQAGQIWDLPARLGHRLDVPLMMTRCTSQVSDLGTAADLVIATSKLEVGFDDPEVGAVLHYKRPRSMASFLQRKGRAGRIRGVRPWTVVVLSDYGHDRWAFQHVDRLFQPQIDAISLPLRNPYVLRTQATYFLIEWLARKVNANEGPFRLLVKPAAPGPQAAAQRILRDLLSGGRLWAEFRRDLSHLFGRGNVAGPQDDDRADTLSEAEIDSILWEQPRAVLRHAVPALLRKLEANWRLADPHAVGNEDHGVRHPLPGFLPSATFAELDSAEVRVQFEQTPVAKCPEWLALSLGLFEGCPGRVSKRFSTRANEPGYWNPLSSKLVGGPITAAAKDAFPGCVLLQEHAGVQIYQPQEITLHPRPRNVKDSSIGNWVWQSLLSGRGPGRSVSILGGDWYRAFLDVRAFLHADNSDVHVLRYAKGLDYRILKERQDPVHGTLTLQAPPEGAETENAQAVPEAIGFQLYADGLRLRVNPRHLAEVSYDLPEDLLARLRSDYLLHLLRTDPALADALNFFLAELIWQTSLSMLSATAIRNHCTLPAAADLLAGVRSNAARRVLDKIFGLQGVDDQGNEIEGRRRQEVQAVWDDPTLVNHIARLEQCLWQPGDEQFRAWVRKRYVATLAQAIRVAAVARLRDVTEDDLNVDVIWSATDPLDASIFLTEQSSGGLGQVETVLRELANEPEAFHDALEHTLRFCPRSNAATELLTVTRRADAGRPLPNRSASALVDALDGVRNASGYEGLSAARDALREQLQHEALPSNRSAVVSIVTTLLSPGSSRDTDRLIHLLNHGWRRAERLLGVGIDARTFSYVAVNAPLWRRALQKVFGAIGGADADDTHLFALAQRLLIAGCDDACPDCLDQRGWYGDIGRPSRALARHWLDMPITEIAVDDPANGNWRSLTAQTLRRRGRARLTAASAAVLAEILPGLLVEEIEVDFLLLPISVSQVNNANGRWTLTLQLRQVIPEAAEAAHE